MIEPHADRPRAITLGADRGYDAEDFVNELRAMQVTPHVARNISGRRSAIDGRTARHPGYAVSLRIRNFESGKADRYAKSLKHSNMPSSQAKGSVFICRKC